MNNTRIAVSSLACLMRMKWMKLVSKGLSAGLLTVVAVSLNGAVRIGHGVNTMPMSTLTCQEFEGQIVYMQSELSIRDQNFLSAYKNQGKRSWCSKVCEYHWVRREQDSTAFNNCVNLCGRCF